MEKYKFDLQKLNDVNTTSKKLISKWLKEDYEIYALPYNFDYSEMPTNWNDGSTNQHTCGQYIAKNNCIFNLLAVKHI